MSHVAMTLAEKPELREHAIERYMNWRRDDGSLQDPWLRLHEHLGARLGPQGKSRTRTHRQRVPGLTTITGTRAACATAELTDPRSMPAKPPRPWLPTTTSCACWESSISHLAG